MNEPTTIEREKRGADSVQRPGSALEPEIACNLCHPGFQRTYWVNLYSNGEMTSPFCATKDEALAKTINPQNAKPAIVKIKI